MASRTNGREGYTFPKRCRIKKSADFELIYKEGKRVFNEYFTVFLLDNGLSFSRLGVTVTKKVGRTHIRNRIKRLIREYFRLNYEDIPAGKDLVVVARKRSVELRGLNEVSERLNRLIK